VQESRSDYTPEEERQHEADLHEWIARYTSGETTLHAFRHWLTHRSWLVDSENKRLWGLYSIIRARIIDFDKGDYTQDHLRASLAFHRAYLNGEAPAGNDPMTTQTIANGGDFSIRTWKARPPAALQESDDAE